MKKLLLLFLAGTFLICAPAYAATHYVKTRADLEAVNSDRSGTFYLMNDIDLSTGGNWTPLCNEGSRFQGTFDGQGHKIVNMTVTAAVDGYAGLFSFIRSGAIIRNLGVEGTVTVASSEGAGGLVGHLKEWSGTIVNCYTNVNITADYAGGFVAASTSSTGVIQNCYSRGTVTEKSSSWTHSLAGFAGRYESTLRNSYSTGNVTATAGSVQGFMNYAGTPTVQNCYFYNTNSINDSYATRESTLSNLYSSSHAVYTTGSYQWQWEIYWNTPSSNFPTLWSGAKITTKVGLDNIPKNLAGIYTLGSDVDCGAGTLTTIGQRGTGFTGTLDGEGHKIYNFSNASVTTGTEGQATAGLIGYLEGGTVKSLKVEGTVNQTASGSYAGGIVALMSSGTLQDCIANVTVTGHASAGGMIGMAWGGTAKRCYALGNATATYASSQAGAFVGSWGGMGATNIYNCFATGTASGHWQGGFAGEYNAGSLHQAYFSGGPNNGLGTYVATASDLYNITHDVYDTGTYPWQFYPTSSSTAPTWSSRNNTTDYPPLAGWFDGDISGTVDSYTDGKAMKLVVAGVDVYSATTTGSGAFTFSNVKNRETNSFVIFVDEGGDFYSNLVGMLPEGTTDITDLDMAEGYIALGDDGGDVDPINNQSVYIAAYADSDVLYTMSGIQIRTRNGGKPWNPAGRTFYQIADFYDCSGWLNEGTWDGSASASGFWNAAGPTSGGGFINSGTATIGDTELKSNGLTNSGSLTMVGPLWMSGGTFDNTGGTFSQPSHIFHLTGGSPSFKGDITFSTFEADVNLAGETLTFEHGKTYTMGDMSFDGEPDNYLLIRSDQAGSRFIINVVVSCELSWLDVKDSEANDQSILATPGLNSGNTDAKETPRIGYLAKPIEGQ